MAKRKKKKVVKTKFKYTAELYGIVFIVLAILGIGKYGPAGEMIASFAVFLVGSLYILLLVGIGIVGSYLLIKREKPDFFSTKLIGLYVFLLGFLVLMHWDFVIKNEGNSMLIFRETINSNMNRMK